MAQSALQSKTSDDEPGEMSFGDFRAQCDAEALERVEHLLSDLAATRRIDTDLLESIIVPVFVNLRAKPADELTWFFPKRPTDYRALHALNACRLATYFAIASKMDDAHAIQLGMAGLLYDTGMWSESMAPVLESRELTVDETAAMETHAAAGAGLLAKVEGADPLCAVVAREHHERADGTGYPARSKADQQHAYSRLMQLIDSFLGMIEPRPFRKALNPVEAMQRLAVQAHRGYYHQPAFRDWLKVMGLFPVGSFVTLNSGEISLVVQSGGDAVRRPKVAVLADELLDFRPRPMELDLANEPAFEIAGAFTNFPKV